MYVRIQSELKSVSSLKWAPVYLPLGPTFFTGRIVFELRLVNVHDLWSWNAKQFIQTWFSPHSTVQWILLWAPHISSGWISIRRTCCRSSGGGWDTAQVFPEEFLHLQEAALFPSGAVCVCVLTTFLGQQWLSGILGPALLPIWHSFQFWCRFFSIFVFPGLFFKGNQICAIF